MFDRFHWRLDDITNLTIPQLGNVLLALKEKMDREARPEDGYTRRSVSAAEIDKWRNPNSG